MPKKNAKSKRMDSERAAEWYVHEIMDCTHTCRAVRTMYQSQDLFGCDVIGKRENGTMVFCQVTAGQTPAVLVRRKKLEVYPWAHHDTVQVCQLVQRQSIENPRKKEWFFRVYEFDLDNRIWIDQVPAVEVPREWFKAYKNK